MSRPTSSRRPLTRNHDVDARAHVVASAAPPSSLPASPSSFGCRAGVSVIPADSTAPLGAPSAIRDVCSAASRDDGEGILWPQAAQMSSVDARCDHARRLVRLVLSHGASAHGGVGSIERARSCESLREARALAVEGIEGWPSSGSQKKISAENFGLGSGVPESRDQGAKTGAFGMSRFIIFTAPYPRSCGLS